MIEELKKNIDGVADVQVIGFSKGSVIVELNIIMDTDAKPVDASAMQNAVEKTIATGSFPGLPIDASYIPKVVEGLSLKLSSKSPISWTPFLFLHLSTKTVLEEKQAQSHLFLFVTVYKMNVIIYHLWQGIFDILVFCIDQLMLCMPFINIEFNLCKLQSQHCVTKLGLEPLTLEV